MKLSALNQMKPNKNSKTVQECCYNIKRTVLFMSNIKRIELSVIIALVAIFVFSVAGFGAECNSVRNDVLRLHILANSDSEADQAVKLLVRDALLESGSELFSGVADKETAAVILEKERNKIISVAESVLQENGFAYSVDAKLVTEYFTTRVYDDFTMPAGEYLALKIILGEGAGHNWWCVMFPPLCLPAATEKCDIDAFFGENVVDIIESSPEYEIRFKIVEVFESFLSKIKN